MKAIILLSIFAIAAAAPKPDLLTPQPKIIPIRQFSQEMKLDGSYKFSFESADGSVREEVGSIINPGTKDALLATVGSYKFLNPNGETIEVHYTADTNGFVPHGTDIHEISPPA